MPLYAAVVIATAGCGEEQQPTRQIRGSVTYQGKPLTHGIVRFYKASGTAAASVAVSEQGVYTAKLPPGDYRVGVESPPLPPPGWQEGDPVPSIAAHMPDKFARPATSGLKATVEAGEETQVIDFRIPAGDR